jgi:histone-lysine N-methyltransferase MLL5
VCLLIQIRHCIEKGILHLYIVTVSSIEKNSEITINHDGTQDASALVNSSGSPHQFICACGNPKECTAINRRNGIHEPTE